MNKKVRRFASKYGISGDELERLTYKTEQLLAESCMNIGEFIRRVASGQAGVGAVEGIIMVFIAIVIIYQLIPEVSNANSVVQTSGNVTSMGKFGAGLGEWLFPLLGVIGIVFLLLRRPSSGEQL